MARKLTDVRPRTYAKAVELDGRPFMITNVEEADSTFENAKPGEKVVRIWYTACDWQDGTDTFPPDGILTMGLSGREYLVKAFDENREAIGPVTLRQAYTAKGFAFWSIEEYEGSESEPDYGLLFAKAPEEKEPSLDDF